MTPLPTLEVLTLGVVRSTVPGRLAMLAGDFACDESPSPRPPPWLTPRLAFEPNTQKNSIPNHSSLFPAKLYVVPAP